MRRMGNIVAVRGFLTILICNIGGIYFDGCMKGCVIGRSFHREGMSNS